MKGKTDQGYLAVGMGLVGFSLHFLLKCTKKGAISIETAKKEGKTNQSVAGSRSQMAIWRYMILT